MFDESQCDALQPSLRIAPLQSPFPTPSNASIRPSPIEPNAYIKIGDDLNAYTGRRKVLAQAKTLDASGQDDWDAMMYSKTDGDPLTTDADPPQEQTCKKQELGSYVHEQSADFVQLPKPSSKAKHDKPPPFCPVSVLNELHEPPPSAALFPPITPNARREDGSPTLKDRSYRTKADKSQESGRRRKKSNERSDSANTAARRYTRGRTKWTQEEIDCLIKGVTVYGTGRWKNILEHPNLHFHERRTPTDLKDRFRVCFPPNAKGRPLPQKIETKDVLKAPLPIAAKELRQKKDHPTKRARKRLWTEAEDAELEKGFRRHGYNWNAMVKDPYLHFDGRSGGQIRDRFRLKYKMLYEGQEVTQLPIIPAARVESRQISQVEPKLVSSQNLGDLTTQAENDEGDIRNRCETASKSPLPYGLNAEDENHRLSNAILHDDLDWDGNLTLPPLTWEDMAIRPIFAFD